MTEHTDGAHAAGRPQDRTDGADGRDAAGRTPSDSGQPDKGEYTDQEPEVGAGTGTGIDGNGDAGEEYVDKDISASPTPEDTGEYEDKDVAGDRPPPAEGGYTDTRG